MWKRGFYDIRYDFFAFIGRNRLKFLVALVLAAGGFIFGLINALVRVSTDDALAAVQNYDIIRLSLGARTFFGYWMGRLFLHLLLIAVISVLGVRELLAYLFYAVIAIYAYQYAFFIGAVFCYAGLTVLPLMLLCIIPFFLLFLCILAYYGVFIICFSHRSGIGQWREFSYYVQCVKFPFLWALAAVFCASLIESALATLLTAGIVL
ncbi:MAG: hypothetical protein FWD58_07840 [Firmicutes bacterium]|nr:hypothetical protein [Bacillota bacterium]